MSKFFDEALESFILDLNEVYIKYTSDRVRVKVQDRVLYTYSTPLVVYVPPQGYIVNVHRYSNTSSRDLRTALEALKKKTASSLFLVDFEIFRGVFDLAWQYDSLSSQYSQLVEWLKKKIIFLDTEPTDNGNYYVFRADIPRSYQSQIVKERFFYAYFPIIYNRKNLNQLFVCELPSPATTIATAREVLKPEPIQRLPETAYQRQGDLFIYPIPADKLVTPEVVTKSGLIRSYLWPMRRLKNLRYGGHVFSDALCYVSLGQTLDRAIEEFSGTLHIFARGYVRHPQHGKMKIGDGKTWYIVRKNTAIRSWGWNGND